MSLDKTDMQFDGTGAASYSNRGASENIRYKVPWADRYTDMQWLAGKVHSDVSFLYCMTIAISPMPAPDSSTGIPAYAFLDATFVTEEEAKRDGGFLESNVDAWTLDEQVGGEALTLKWKNWKWSDTSVILKADEATNAVKIVPVGTITVSGTWSAFDRDKIAGRVGQINESDFLGFSTHELLFNGAMKNERTAVTGSDAYDISYSFSWQPQTWRKFWRDEDQTWAILVNTDGDKFPYTAGPFSDLSPANW